MYLMLRVRREQATDIPAIWKINERAFNGSVEARLVDLLREANKATISLVAMLNDELVGHILFSPVTIEYNPRNLRGLGLAPIAVLPEYQKQGIDSRLVMQGLEESRNKGYDLVVVLDHVSYFPLFGFKRASLYGIINEYDVDESFMALELRGGALNAVHGVVKYQVEFKEAETDS